MKLSNKKATLTALASGLILSGMAGVASASEVQIKDVDSKSTYHEDIQYVVQNGIMSTNAMKFSPYQRVTKELAAQSVGKALHIDGSEVEKKVTFKDVSTSNANYAYISTLTGLSAFTTSANFNGSKAITRQEVARLIVEAYDFPVNKKNKFNDTSNTQYKDYVSTAVELGIMKPRKAKIFNPSGTVTRAEMARIIHLAELKDLALNSNGPSGGKNPNPTAPPTTGGNTGGTTTPPTTGGNNGGTTTEPTNPPATGGGNTTAPTQPTIPTPTAPEPTKPTTPSSSDYPVGETGLKYLKHDEISLKGDTLQVSNYMPVTLQRETVSEPVPGVTAAIMEAMRAENRANGQNAKLVHDPELDKLANQRLNQWDAIWSQYGATAGRASYKSHFAGYVPLASVQVPFYNNKYNDANEIATIASDWLKLGSSPEQFGVSVIRNFNSSSLHYPFYANVSASGETESQIAFGVGYRLNPSGSYNIIILRGAVYDSPTIDTMYSVY